MGDTTATPKVSVIIPAYNQAFFLHDAIQSVFRQSFRDYEIVVVDDGSTDDTAAVAQHYGERIHYVFQENQGLAGARNTGIREANGELIALLDSDDLWLPEYLERMVTLADVNPKAMVFYCAARCMDENGLPLKQVVGYQKIKSVDLYNYLLRSNFIIPSTVLIRKAVINQADCFDQTLRSCEDWDLWLNLLSTGHDFYGIPDVLAHYRIHANSLSADVSKMQFFHQSVVEKYFGEDDQQYDKWREEKKLAFGGYYRYQLLTNIQKQNKWKGVEILRKAIQTDLMTCSDIDFYYELALGSQPVGYRDTEYLLELVENVENIEILLADLFLSKDDAIIQANRRIICGTAYKAIGLLAYNTGQFSLCRKYLWLAVKQQPGLLREKWITGCFLKSFLGKNGLSILRNFRKRRIRGLEE